MSLDDLSTMLEEHDQGVKTILSEHPEVKILFERRQKLPAPLEINGVNPILHVLLEGVVENQLQDPDLPEVKEAIDRLEGKGLSKHAGRACVAGIFIEFFYETLYHKKPFDKGKYKRQLSILGTDLRKMGRNEPCPCGSGLKFKYCCAHEADKFKISELAGALYLGQGGYMLGSPVFIVKDPLDSLLQLENRVHIARYLDEHGDIQGAKQALEENVVLVESYQGDRRLKNALQDLQLFCMNHQSLRGEGIQVAERLMALSQSDEERGSYWCDKADLLARIGRVGEAEQEYRNLFDTLPHWHFGRYRYALFLEDNGKRDDAIIILRELVADKRKIDGEAYSLAREVLQGWEEA